MKISNTHKLVSFAGFCSLLLMFSCTGKSSGTVTDAPSKTVCALQENISIIAEPVSFAVADNGCFVLTDFKNVYLYSSDGRQLRQIGHSGRAQFEYLNPSCVKIHKDTIYVWSANSMEFITYTMDGESVAEYQYGSAITDFVPDDDYIFIYTAGNRFENIVDIYDKSSQKTASSLTEASPEHKLLLHTWASVPMCIMDNHLYYAPKDRLEILCYDMNGNKLTTAAEIDSDSFHVEEISDYDSMARDRRKRSPYLRENSQTLALFQEDGKMFLLTIEGEGKMTDDAYDTSGLHFGLYSADRKGDKTADYSYDSIGTVALFSSNSDGLYFLKLSDDETQPHTLRKLVL